MNAPRNALEIQRRVEWSDTDASGHHHNSVVIRWVEAAEAALIRALAIRNYFPNAPRVRQVINFRNVLWFQQAVRIQIWIEKIGTSSLTLAFTVHGHDDTTDTWRMAADGEVTTVFVDKKTGRPTPWPQAMRSAFETATGT